MPRSCFALSAICFVFVASSVLARPNFGRNCSDCHSGGEPPAADALRVINFDGMVDPDESNTGAPDRGELKFFEVEPGGTVDLTILVDLQNLVNYEYAVELKRMETTGVENFGVLTYGADSDWFFQTGDALPDPDRPYYTIPEDEGIPFTAPREFTFTMFVDPTTDPDFYDLEFAMAGQPSFFYTDEHFYLHVTPEPATTVLLVLAMVMSVRRRTRSRA